MTDQAIKRFIEQVRQASRSKGKTVSLSLMDAQDLANAMALVLADHVKLQEDLLEAREGATVQMKVVSGGSFGEG